MYEREQTWGEGARGFPVWAGALDAVWPTPGPHGAGLLPAPRGAASPKAGPGCRSRPGRIPPHCPRSAAQRAVVGIPAERRVEEHGGLAHPEAPVAGAILLARERRL